MCSIIASFSGDKLRDLYELNSYRGSLSFSFAAFTAWEDEIQLPYLKKGKGKMPEEYFDKPFYYAVCHSQAPTTQADNIHPAEYYNAYLWHNGIVKQKNLEPGTWDTSWLLKEIVTKGWEALSSVDGTFACIMYKDNDLFVFRNEISPLFYDDDMNFSSTKFGNSKSLSPNIVYRIDFRDKLLVEVSQFKTFENPYYIPEL